MLKACADEGMILLKLIFEIKIQRVYFFLCSSYKITAKKDPILNLKPWDEGSKTWIFFHKARSSLVIQGKTEGLTLSIFSLKGQSRVGMTKQRL